jgi:hypothetical protein
MSASDAAPLPRLGEVFFDVRGSSRSMRLSWYSDTGVAVFSIWQGGTCTGTFRLPMDDLPRMVEALQRGPRGSALPADARDARDGTGERPRRGLAAAPTDPAMTAVSNFPGYAAGPAQAPVTGEFRAPGPDDGSGFQNGPGGDFGGRGAGRRADRADRPGLHSAPEPRTGSIQAVPYGDAAYGDDPLGMGGPSGAYRQEPYRDRGPALPEPSFQPSYPDAPAAPAYRDSGPQPYQDSGPQPYRGSGPQPYQDSGPQPYRDDPLGMGGAGRSGGYREDLTPYRDEPYDPAYREAPGDPRDRGYADDPFQSVYPEDVRDRGYPDDPRPGSRPYGPPADREQRAPRGRS